MGDLMQVEVPQKRIKALWVIPISALALLLGMVTASVRYSFQLGAYYAEYESARAQISKEILAFDNRLKIVEVARETQGPAIRQLEQTLAHLAGQVQVSQQERKEDSAKLNGLVWDIRERLAAMDAKLGGLIDQRRGDFSPPFGNKIKPARALVPLRKLPPSPRPGTHEFPRAIIVDKVHAIQGWRPE